LSKILLLPDNQEAFQNDYQYFAHIWQLIWQYKPYIEDLVFFYYLCKAKEFCVCISHPMMGAASTGTGTTGFFSFFIGHWSRRIK
jgi:hypothetical protein